MHASGENKDKQRTKTTRRGWHFAIVVILFVLTLLLQFISEHSDVVIENGPLPHWLQQRIQKTFSWFNSPFGLIPRPLEARYTALVSIRDEREGSLPGPCPKRRLLTKLLPAINAAHPAMIVVDIALTGDDASDSCTKDPQETTKIVSAISMVAKTTPIAIGQASWKLEELTEEQATHLRDQGFGENDLLLRKPIPLNTETKNVSFGLIRLNERFERVPVVWLVHQDNASSAQPVKALGFVAAEMYRSTFPDGVRRLQDLEKAGYHPVTALLPESNFAMVHAIDVMCSVRPADHDWASCPDPAGNGDGADEKLRGRVVVVGRSDNPNDLWNTNVGRLAGYVLHANYIEALLDARAYRPFGFWPTFWLSLLLLILIEVPFWILKNQIAKALLFSTLIYIIVLFLAKYVALVNFGLYISLFAPNVLILGVLLLHGVAERSERQGN